MSQCIKFEGTNSYVDCGGGGTLNLNAAFTIEVLFKKLTSTIAPNMQVLGRWAGGNGYIMYLQGGTGRLSMYLNGSADYANNTIPTVNQWIRVSATWTAGGRLRIYKNGALADTLAVFAACGDSGNNFLISGTYGAYSRFQGAIAQITVYNRALTLAEIAYNYAHPNNPIRRSRVLDLNQESFFGGTWTDLSGNGNNGTLTAGPLLNPCNNVAGRNVSV
jgi:hypothetical protein